MNEQLIKLAKLLAPHWPSDRKIGILVIYKDDRIHAAVRLISHRDCSKPIAPHGYPDLADPPTQGQMFAWLCERKKRALVSYCENAAWVRWSIDFAVDEHEAAGNSFGEALALALCSALGIEVSE